MKKLLTLLAILTLSSTTFSYTLTTTDRALVDSFEPKIEVMMEEENEKFMKIIDKLDVLLPAFDTESRIYAVLDYLQQAMIQMIPEEPTVIEELNLEGLFGELLDEGEDDSVDTAGSAMNQGEMQNTDEQKLDLGDNEEEEMSNEAAQEQYDEDIDVVDMREEEESNEFQEGAQNDSGGSGVEYTEEEIEAFQNPDNSDYEDLPAGVEFDEIDDEEEEFDVSDAGFTFDYEFDESEFDTDEEEEDYGYDFDDYDDEYMDEDDFDDYDFDDYEDEVDFDDYEDDYDFDQEDDFSDDDE